MCYEGFSLIQSKFMYGTSDIYSFINIAHILIQLQFMMSLPVATGSTSVSYTEAYQQMLVLKISQTIKLPAVVTPYE